MSDVIHQEITFKAKPERLYEALTDQSQFGQATGGAPTEISRDAGGAFSCFGGMVTGRNIELVPGKRIVQAWRAKSWPEGVYSLARFEIRANGAESLLVFDHSGFPDDQRTHLDAGWHSNYWEPLRKHLG